MSWWLGAYSSQGAVNTGIYNCRTVVGGAAPSLHGEGRAVDLGVRPYSAAYGTVVANALVASSKELGVQCVIWNRQIWSGSYPDSGFRAYQGTADHHDHLHVELTREAAKSLTPEYVVGILTPKQPTSKLPRRVLYVKSGGRMNGEDVRRLQDGLNRVFPSYSRLTADGYYGPTTAQAIKDFQRRSGLEADGVVGPTTWAALARFGI